MATESSTSANRTHRRRATFRIFALFLVLFAPGCSSRPSRPAAPARTISITRFRPMILRGSGPAITCGCKTPEGEFALGTEKGEILLTNLQSQQLEDSGIKLDDLPRAMQFVGTSLLVSTSTKQRAYELSHRQKLWERDIELYTAEFLAAQDEHTFYCDLTSDRIDRIDTTTQASETVFDQSQSQGKSATHHHSYYSLALSPDKTKLAIGFQTGASLVDISSKSEQFYFRMPDYTENQVVFSPISNTLYVAGNSVAAWDLVSGRRIRENSNVPWDICSIAISTDGALIAVGESAGVRFPCYFCLLDNNLNLLHRIEAGLTKVSYIAFVADSHELITASHGGDVKLWDIDELLKK